MSEMKVEMGKQYRTRDGLEVRIYAVDGDKEMPVHGAVLTKHGWKVNSWALDGRWCPNMTDARDLVEVRPRIKREMWVNVYPNGVDDELWCTKEVADQQALTSRIACVRVEIDVEEGHGL